LRLSFPTLVLPILAGVFLGDPALAIPPRQLPLQPIAGPLTVEGAVVKAIVAVAKDRDSDPRLSGLERELSAFDVYVDPTATDRYVVTMMPNEDVAANAKTPVRQMMYEIDKKTFRVVHKARLR
jgi:hypothetical protein